MRFVFTAVSTVIFLSSFAVEASCRKPQWQGIPGTGIIETQPRLQWTPTVGATYYRVEIESRVPEGRRIAAIDTSVTDTFFKPPQPLTDSRARVVAKVTAHCNDEVSASSEPLRFEIDVSSRCVLSADSIRTEGDVFAWNPIEGATSYQISLFDGVGGKLLSQHQALQPTWKAANTSAQASVVGIRPRCKAGWGESVYHVIGKVAER